MKKISIIVFLALICAGCARVDITKTSKGFYEPTNPNNVEILKTTPKRNFEELGTFTVSNFAPDEDAKMHNAIRVKSSALGADAVIITQEGLIQGGWGVNKWATGVAIHYIN
jgi:hypothetical protein